MATSDKDLRRSCYNEWINLQELELSELLQTLTLKPKNHDDDDIVKYEQLIEKIIKHFEDYIENRARLARERASPYFAPPWCTSLENSALWIGGCRPSSFIRLLYALCGLEIESQLADFLHGSKEGKLGKLTPDQLSLVDKLQSKTVREEEGLTNRKACLQEDMADHPFAEVAMKSEGPCELNREVNVALERNQLAMACLLEDADRLRLETVKEIIEILKPVQAVQFLAAGKKLRLCMHEWGMKKEDNEGGSISQHEEVNLDGQPATKPPAIG